MAKITVVPPVPEEKTYTLTLSHSELKALQVWLNEGLSSRTQGQASLIDGIVKVIEKQFAENLDWWTCPDCNSNDFVVRSNGKESDLRCNRCNITWGWS
jgi:hypothetical protein